MHPCHSWLDQESSKFNSVDSCFRGNDIYVKLKINKNKQNGGGKMKKGKGKILIILSIVALILAALVSVFKMNLWLAGTQWILVAIALAVYAIFLKGCDCKCCAKDNQ